MRERCFKGLPGDISRGKQAERNEERFWRSKLRKTREKLKRKKGGREATEIDCVVKEMLASIISFLY